MVSALDSRDLGRAAARRKLARITAPLVAAALVVAGSAAAALGELPAPTHWCGVAASADQPDAASAFLIHVIYAVPADAPDRFGERAFPIVNDLAAVGDWWRSQDPTRAPRLDLLAAGCDSSTGRLDLTDVRLPHDAAYYADPKDGFTRITADIEQRFAFSTPEKKYLVYYDGPVQRHGVCGTSPRGPARTNATSVVYLDSSCARDLGSGNQAAATATHELLHNLDALPRTHFCAGNRAHACDDTHDILYYALDDNTAFADLRLDVGHDDYYTLDAQTGNRWDVRDSPFLEHLDSPHPPAALGPRDPYATSHGTSVNLSWTPPSAATGLLYRIYRGGRLLTETGKLSTTDSAAVGTTIIYTLRAADQYGYLSPPQTLRILVGTGLIDDYGQFIRDTIPPPKVTGLHAVPNGTSVVLRWAAIASGDLAGYRIFRNGHTFIALRRQNTVTLSLARAHGTWNVAAIDSSGNIGRRSTPIRIP